MDAKIDFLSFTIPLNLGGVGHSTDVHQEIMYQIHRLELDALTELLVESKPDLNKGRKIYSAGAHWKDSNVSLWWGGVANHILCEISGVGCQKLRDYSAMLSTVAHVQERCSRIDIAVDLPDAGKPVEFIAAKQDNRFKVTQTNDESTGWTQYVGSRKSDRFARVYLYAPPHPRAGILRVEHVLRSDYAKACAKGVIVTNLQTQVTLLGNTFGWKHERWQPTEMTDGKLKVKRHDKDDAATLRWLIKAVAPCLIKSHENGLIDVVDFIENYVIQPMQNKQE